MRTLEREMADTKETLKELHTLALQAKGGWKALMLIAGIEGAAGALVAKFTFAFGVLAK